MRLDGKSAVITGGASGIGAASAEVFAREGARVGVLDQTLDRAEAVARELPAVAAGAHVAIAIDVASTDSVETAFAAVDAALGGIDVLVNSAGIGGGANPLEASFEEWHRVIDVNLNGSFYCAQQAARRMADQGRGGSIVNISSGAGLAAVNNRTAYCASKAGVLGLTRSLALDLGPLGIRVNAVCPGMTRSGMTKPYYEDADWVAQVEADIPLGRSGEPRDTAETIAFLASDLAGYITGTELPVDGGILSSRRMGSANTPFATRRAQ